MALVCVRLFPVPLGFVATGQHGKGAAADFCASATAPAAADFCASATAPFLLSSAQAVVFLLCHPAFLRSKSAHSHPDVVSPKCCVTFAVLFYHQKRKQNNNIFVTKWNQDHGIRHAKRACLAIPARQSLLGSSCQFTVSPVRAFQAARIVF